MIDDASGPERWSEEERRLFRRLAADDPAWEKVRAHPELFGFDVRGLGLVTYLHERGLMVHSPIPTEGEGSSSWVMTSDGSELSAWFGAEPRVVQKVGTWPDDAATRRVLAYSGVEQFDRYVSAAGADLTVSIGMTFPPRPEHDLLKQLHTRASQLKQALDKRGQRSFAGHDDLVERFAGEGLAVPRLPSVLRPTLRRLDEWRWSTRTEDPELRVADYLMDTRALLAGPVEDHVTVSHYGHGMNSYALTWRVAYGPLAAIIQDAWGGAFVGPEANGALAELFCRLSRLVSACEARMNGMVGTPAGEWIRPVQLAVSPLRSIEELTVWDPLQGARVPIEVVDFWEDVLTWVQDCAIPHPWRSVE